MVKDGKYRRTRGHCCMKMSAPGASGIRQGVAFHLHAMLCAFSDQYFGSTCSGLVPQQSIYLASALVNFPLSIPSVPPFSALYCCLRLISSSISASLRSPDAYHTTVAKPRRAVRTQPAMAPLARAVHPCGSQG